MRFKNKKGSDAITYLYVFMFLIIITITAVISYFVFDKFNEEWQRAPGVSAQSKAITAEVNSNQILALDGSIILWFGILFAGSIATAFVLGSSNVFFIIFLLISIVTFFIIPSFANMAVEVLTDSTFSSITNQIPMTMFIINNIVIFMIAYITFVGIALYGKSVISE